MIGGCPLSLNLEHLPRAELTEEEGLGVKWYQEPIMPEGGHCDYHVISVVHSVGFFSPFLSSFPSFSHYPQLLSFLPKKTFQTGRCGTGATTAWLWIWVHLLYLSAVLHTDWTTWAGGVLHLEEWGATYGSSPGTWFGALRRAESLSPR